MKNPSTPRSISSVWVKALLGLTLLVSGFAQFCHSLFSASAGQSSLLIHSLVSVITASVLFILIEKYSFAGLSFKWILLKLQQVYPDSTDNVIKGLLSSFSVHSLTRLMGRRTRSIHASQLSRCSFTVLGLLVLGTGTAFSQVAYVGFASATNTGLATLTVPNVSPSGTNKLLLVSVGVGSTVATFNVGGDPTPPTVVSVTYGGTPMNLVQATLGAETRLNVYSLVNPVNGPLSVVVTLSGNTILGTTPTSTVRINASAAWFTGVHPTVPLGTPVSVASNVPGNPLNLTLPSTSSDDMIYSAVSVDEGNGVQGITVAAGQTTISNQSGNAAVSSAASYEPGTGSAVTSTYTFTDSQDHSGVIVAIKRLICPSPGCGTVTLVKNP